jgi:hypothetical protein
LAVAPGPSSHGAQRVRHVGQVFDGLPEILAQRPAQGARSRRRVTEFARPALGGILDRLAERDGVDDRV